MAYFLELKNILKMIFQFQWESPLDWLQWYRFESEGVYDQRFVHADILA